MARSSHDESVTDVARASRGLPNAAARSPACASFPIFYHHLPIWRGGGKHEESEILMPTRGSHHAPFSKTEGAFTFDYHLEMLNDDRRVSVVVAAIDSVANTRHSFLELGCGTGIFTRHASRRFSVCRAYEKDPKIFTIAVATLEDEIKGGKVRLINSDVLDATIDPEPFDVVFCEMISTWLITEQQISVLNVAASSFAHENTVFIPRRVVNIAELCFFDYNHTGVLLRAPFVEFTGRRRGETMSSSVVAQEILFGKEQNDETARGRLEFVSIVDGVVNAIRLSTVIEFAPNCVYSSGDALVPDTVVPLSSQVHVKAGSRVEVAYKIDFGGGFEAAEFDCRLLS